ncbi:helix-turn-helix domain-containing protein [Chengkuizengella axinellae]|uniref:Helix-turn-helix domain-containing protein n=1 Tax=Chengkuizengella axinellae TaxID=3064388 RepID=A0ABT9IW23_9BACL|nr:helix-turn-helix domain-containing protein [Chengkuizengella sp. 2205SS18-9]MDP5273566.1 helix-turn-helix domain-containing protein [Chengkuizengella sp. 2205SS18-9]
MKKYMSITEVANEFNISKTSVYKLMEHSNTEKRLEPINKETHRGDGGYRFKAQDVERIKAFYEKKDLTSSDAAKILNVSTTYIHKLIKNKEIKYYEDEYKGKRTYFIKKEEVEQYKLDHPELEKNETIYHKKEGLFLFQPFKKGDQLARIHKINSRGKKKVAAFLITENGEEIPYEKADEEGWKRGVVLEHKKNITTYGTAKFEFPKPAAINSLIYDMIVEMLKHIGANNMKIDVGDKIVVEVKKSELKGIQSQTHFDYIDAMKKFIVEGKIVEKYDGVLIDTGLTPMTFYVDEQSKEKIMNEISEAGVSMHEWFKRKISE